MPEKTEYFIVFSKNVPDSWYNGPDQTCFVEASSPKEALDKLWKLEEMGKHQHLNYEAEVYENANDYHKHRKPLVRRIKDSMGEMDIFYRRKGEDDEV